MTTTNVIAKPKKPTLVSLRTSDTIGYLQELIEKDKDLVNFALNTKGDVRAKVVGIVPSRKPYFDKPGSPLISHISYILRAEPQVLTLRFHDKYNGYSYTSHNMPVPYQYFKITFGHGVGNTPYSLGNYTTFFSFLPIEEDPDFVFYNILPNIHNMSICTGTISVAGYGKSMQTMMKAVLDMLYGTTYNSHILEWVRDRNLTMALKLLAAEYPEKLPNANVGKMLDSIQDYYLGASNPLNKGMAWRGMADFLGNFTEFNPLHEIAKTHTEQIRKAKYSTTTSYIREINQAVLNPNMTTSAHLIENAVRNLKAFYGKNVMTL